MQSSQEVYASTTDASKIYISVYFWHGVSGYMQFLEDYLSQYQVQKGSKICEPTWTEFFGAVVTR